MIRAGELRDRATFEKLVSSGKDTFGESTATWTAQFTTSAKVSPLSAKDLVEAQQVIPEASLTVTVRWDENSKLVTGDFRIIWGTKILHIEGQPINVGAMNTEIQFMCSDKGKTSP